MDLGLDIDLMPILLGVRRQILMRRNSDYAASRGEYLNGRLLAVYMGWDFIDPADYIVFSQQGVFQSELTNTILSDELSRHDLVLLGHPLVAPEVRPGDDLGGQGLLSEGPRQGWFGRGDGQTQVVLTSVAPLALVVLTAASSKDDRFLTSLHLVS